MLLNVVNDLGQAFAVEIDPSMELENVMALLEAESGIPVAEQSISHEGRELNRPSATMQELGVGEHGTLLIRRRVAPGPGPQGPAGQDAETMRLQLLGDPELMRQLEAVHPDLTAAARDNPTRFAELLRQTSQRQAQAAQEQDLEAARLNADPYDIEAQRRIEEAIRQQAVLENMEHALEYAPESFGRVIMLYVPVEVNGTPVKAFVDSGAQQTIMSPECAEQCGIMRLLDKRFAGIARGVGTAKILGRVHSAQMKVADVHLPCAFTIMEGRDVDLLLGLDMLKAHQACIDLGKNVLRIQGREVQFLSEHELPDKARIFETPHGDEGTEGPSTPSNPTPAQPNPQQRFPGAGNTIGSGPTNTAAPAPRRNAPPASSHPESAIQTLMGLGATREIAISTLDAAGGNLDVAASLLF
ncbi:unnamed protein product [Peniophora sp. CBMAI 1063]|nr:unnamed protein product [Peniophora sp. CBMAI 1063]